MSAYLFETKAAVHLNNVGIELLVRGCHRQALETFQDAVKVMQLSPNILRPPTNGKNACLTQPATLEDHNRLIQIKEMLHKSARQLVTTQGGQGNATTLTVVSDDHDPFLIAFEALSLTTTYLIRIESIKDESETTDDVAVRTAIILYNYGTSYHILANHTSLPAHRTQLQLGVLQMLRLSFQTLMPFEGERNGEAGMHWSRCDCLTLLPTLLRQLIRVTRLLNMSSECNQYMVQLDYIRNLLQGMHIIKQLITRQHAPSA